MTIKEDILKSLYEINNLTNYLEIHNHIIKSNYYDFGPAKTPSSTISALLGDFIRNGDTRVKRIKTRRWKLFLLLDKKRAKYWS